MPVGRRWIIHREMISFLKGKISLKADKYIILEVNGIGYKVFLSEKTFSDLPENDENIKIFTFLCLKEKAMELYGFLTFKEFELFEVLNGISGIGPKTSLILASFGSLEKLKKALESPDQEFFKKIKGVGQKKLQKITLEITGKIKEMEKQKNFSKDDSLEALKSLGFTKERAKNALAQINKDVKSPEERVKKALEILAKD